MDTNTTVLAVVAIVAVVIIVALIIVMQPRPTQVTPTPLLEPTPPVGKTEPVVADVSILCDLDMGGEVSAKGLMKLEPPNMAMDVVLTSGNQTMHLMAMIDGDDFYMKVPELTGTPSWYKMKVSEVEGVSSMMMGLDKMHGSSLEEIEQSFTEAGMFGFDCDVVADIPDSEFRPPASEQIIEGKPSGL